MKKLLFKIVLLIVLGLFVNSDLSFGGGLFIDQNDTDHNDDALVYYFDLRERETFVQITNVFTSDITIHVQVFNVGENCNENNFFDTLTGNDTHVYNLRDILTNNGNPSGVVLPDNAYGIVAILVVDNNGVNNDEDDYLIGNFRIIDNNGYEYRTNAQAEDDNNAPNDFQNTATFNFNTISNITLSDVVGIAATDNQETGELETAVLDNFFVFDVDIYNNSEVPFSCRNITFACVDEDNPLLEELLEEAGTSVASFEYGINEVIPHSKGAELLCPGNNISEGIVKLNLQQDRPNSDDFYGYVGLNNGNGRGSMDSIWVQDDPSGL